LENFGNFQKMDDMVSSSQPVLELGVFLAGFLELNRLLFWVRVDIEISMWMSENSVVREGSIKYWMREFVELELPR
jgi:hypothetical protein